MPSKLGACMVPRLKPKQRARQVSGETPHGGHARLHHPDALSFAQDAAALAVTLLLLVGERARLGAQPLHTLCRALPSRALRSCM